MEFKTITVHVTQKHIEAGQRKKCTQCPVALAVCDALGVVNDPNPEVDPYIGVGPHSVSFYSLYGVEDATRISSPSPQCVVEFINSFDYGSPVEPFSFELEVPECLLS